MCDAGGMIKIERLSVACRGNPFDELRQIAYRFRPEIVGRNCTQGVGSGGSGMCGEFRRLPATAGADIHDNRNASGRFPDVGFCHQLALFHRQRAELPGGADRKQSGKFLPHRILHQRGDLLGGDGFILVHRRVGRGDQSFEFLLHHCAILLRKLFLFEVFLV